MWTQIENHHLPSVYSTTSFYQHIPTVEMAVSKTNMIVFRLFMMSKLGDKNIEWRWFIPFWIFCEDIFIRFHHLTLIKSIHGESSFNFLWSILTSIYKVNIFKPTRIKIMHTNFLYIKSLGPHQFRCGS